jgi:transcriptional regulator with XRE-family HTH domain
MADRTGADMPEDTSAHTQSYDARAIGLRLRHVRKSRRMTLRVLAGLTGVSIAHLSHIENGLTALDSLKLLAALADTLRIASSDLVSSPVPRPANSHTDTLIEAVRLALIAAAAGRPDGEVQPVEQLRQRFEAAVTSDWSSHGDALPGLIADLHTTLEQGREMTELLPLAVMVHTQVSQSWLFAAGAPADLRWQGALLARSAAQELADPTWLGVSGRCSALVLLDHGAFDQCRQELDAITVPTASSEGMQLAGALALCRALVLVADNRRAESAAALEHATELAARTGQGDAFMIDFGPVYASITHMFAALECGEPDEAIKVATTVNPLEHPDRERRATYWMEYGNALTRVRRRDDAAQAMLRAEKLHPMRVLHDPLTKDTLVELVACSKDDALGRAIRGMAYRAGLPL